MPQRGLSARTGYRPTGPGWAWTLTLSGLSYCPSLLPGKKLERKTGHNDFTLQERRVVCIFQRPGRTVILPIASALQRLPPPLPIHLLPAGVHLLSHKLNSFNLTPSSWQVLKRDKGGGIGNRTDGGKQDTAAALWRPGPLQTLHML